MPDSFVCILSGMCLDVFRNVCLKCSWMCVRMCSGMCVWNAHGCVFGCVQECVFEMLTDVCSCSQKCVQICSIVFSDVLKWLKYIYNIWMCVHRGMCSTVALLPAFCPANIRETNQHLLQPRLETFLVFFWFVFQKLCSCLMFTTLCFHICWNGVEIYSPSTNSEK